MNEFLVLASDSVWLLSGTVRCHIFIYEHMRVSI